MPDPNDRDGLYSRLDLLAKEIRRDLTRANRYEWTHTASNGDEWRLLVEKIEEKPLTSR